MYVSKADVSAYGRTPGCRCCRDVILEKAHCASHTGSRECRERMTRMFSEIEAGKLRVKASDDRWINAGVRRSDILIAEAEEKKRKIENENEDVIPAIEATTLTGGSSGSGGPLSVHPVAAASRKRRAEVEVADIDPSAGDAAASPSVVVENTGTKRQADTSVADIDPQSGD